MAKIDHTSPSSPEAEVRLQEQVRRSDRIAMLIDSAAVAMGRALLIVAIVGIWACASGRWIDAQSVSDPWSVMIALGELIETGRLWPQLGQTVTEVFAGYAMGAVAGASLAFSFGACSRRGTGHAAFLARIVFDPENRTGPAHRHVVRPGHCP